MGRDQELKCLDPRSFLLYSPFKAVWASAFNLKYWACGMWHVACGMGVKCNFHFSQKESKLLQINNFLINYRVHCTVEKFVFNLFKKIKKNKKIKAPLIHSHSSSIQKCSRRHHYIFQGGFPPLPFCLSVSSVDDTENIAKLLSTTKLVKSPFCLT